MLRLKLQYFGHLMRAKLLHSCSTLFDPMDWATCQALLSMGFSKQEYWSGLPFPPPGDIPDLGIELESSYALAGGFSIINPTWEAHEEPTHRKRPWCWERLRAGGEGSDIVGWHHWLNGVEFEQALGDSEGQENLEYWVHGVANSRTQRSGWTTTTCHPQNWLIKSVVFPENQLSLRGDRITVNCKCHLIWVPAGAQPGPPAKFLKEVVLTGGMGTTGWLVGREVMGGSENGSRVNLQGGPRPLPLPATLSGTTSVESKAWVFYPQPLTLTMAPFPPGWLQPGLRLWGNLPSSAPSAPRVVTPGKGESPSEAGLASLEAPRPCLGAQAACLPLWSQRRVACSGQGTARRSVGVYDFGSRAREVD